MKYDWMHEHRVTYRLARMCSALQVSRSGYYKHCSRGISTRDYSDAGIVVALQQLAVTHAYRYGSPRMTVALGREGLRCSENRVARLMRVNGLGARRKKQYRKTTQQDRKAIASPNHLRQCFRVYSINRVWLTDITYIYTKEGWLFLTAVLDLGSRRIVGWSMQNTLEQRGTLEALQQALGRRRPPEGLLIHSDRGSQFTSHAYRGLLRAHKITQSMSGTGNCYDNAPMESFFGTLKNELVHQCQYKTRAEACRSIFDYIESYYNTERIHSALGYQTPAEWEQQQEQNSIEKLGE